jgi:hypothetical protein
MVTNDVAYIIQRHPIAKMVVQLDSLAPYLAATRDINLEGGVVSRRPSAGGMRVNCQCMYAHHRRSFQTSPLLRLF